MSNERSAGANPLAAGRNVQIYNVFLEEANSEYLEHLLEDTRKFIVRVREVSGKVKLAFKSGESTSCYITIDHAGYCEDNISITDLWLFMQSDTPGLTVEIICWN